MQNEVKAALHCHFSGCLWASVMSVGAVLHAQCRALPCEWPLTQEGVLRPSSQARAGGNGSSSAPVPQGVAFGPPVQMQGSEGHEWPGFVQ